MGRLSISQRLRKAKRPGLKAQIAAKWSKEWESEFLAHMREIEWALRTGDYELVEDITYNLKIDSLKRFTALPRVISIISTAEDDI